MRLVSWNCNGIRNLFDFDPEYQEKSIKFILEKLGADIMCFQETKIQRKDLTHEMINVSGYLSFYTFSRKRKGYSGVAIYVKESVCIPLKAEEGITGYLIHSKKGIPYIECPKSISIGGYTEMSNQHALELDQEGRCIILDMDFFVLFGIYCPFNSNSERSKFRQSWIETLDRRIRNLRKMKRNIIIVGDINVVRDKIDSSYDIDELKEEGMEDFDDSCQRTWLNKLLLPHPEGFMIDLCRHFHPDRKEMFTCWNSKINARTCNFGTRIDYILITEELLPWFEYADIQANVMGSDHCPIFAEIRSQIYNWRGSGKTDNILDLLNKGIFVDGILVSELPKPPHLETRNFLEFSFQDIKLMFKKQESGFLEKKNNNPYSSKNFLGRSATEPLLHLSKKKRLEGLSNQSDLSSYFQNTSGQLKNLDRKLEKSTILEKEFNSLDSENTNTKTISQISNTLKNDTKGNSEALELQKKTWNNIFAKPSPPLCNVHQKPCIELRCKKPGVNFGRYFWVCSNPISKDYKHQNTSDSDIENKFKCGYFRWSSNHNQKS
ncbi:exodeoxyribonuclease III [Pneumocystis carinii B80]|uniref:DNA-(apurinic or apyrimidinic site) endonuclease n=1 Tax=Pneumocystis carinii (strain B80) TaxID=1408658 RepID=A0A0W4ZPL6_PNEC8|nr:exodeoxyribonuclease III [Pneumocystis carinii B80]KTW30322.1 exodeoxyribonuclease III [Pneumocystis carinii B80]